MNKPLLGIIANFRKRLSNPKFDKGELSGTLEIDEAILKDLNTLSESGVIEDVIIKDGSSMMISKVHLSPDENFKASIVIYTGRIGGETYYESSKDFVLKNQKTYPTSKFYIFNLDYFSENTDLPKLLSDHKDIISLITLLQNLADYVTTNLGEPDTLIFFQKLKLNLPIIYNQGVVNDLPFLNELIKQLSEAHDREER